MCLRIVQFLTLQGHCWVRKVGFLFLHISLTCLKIRKYDSFVLCVFYLSFFNFNIPKNGAKAALICHGTSILLAIV